MAKVEAEVLTAEELLREARGEARAAAAAGARRASVAGGGSDEAEVEGNAEEHQDSNSKVR